jgi:hypothetical protein
MIHWVANTQYLHLFNKTILQKCIFTWNMKLFLSCACNFPVSKFIEDFAQTKYCSSNEKKKKNCRVWYAGSYLQVWDKQMQTGMTLGHKCFVTQFSKKEVLYYDAYRWTVLSYFVPTKTRPTYICTRRSRAIWAFGGWVVYCTTHGRFSTCFHLKFAIYFLIKAEIIDNWYRNPTSHVKTFSSSSKSHHSIAPLFSKISTKFVQFCRQMSQHVRYEIICIWYGIRLQVNVVPQCRNTLQYIVSYVKFLEDFVQTKCCYSNKTENTNFCRVQDAGSSW